METNNVKNPHIGARVLAKGPTVETASSVVILLHGRGGSAENMLSLFDEFGLGDVAALAPQAAGNTWYPYSFLAPRDQNEPFLSSALDLIETTVSSLIDKGVASSRIVLLGFSQGACLASEFVVRNPRKYGGLIAFTGGLIGPLEQKEKYDGELLETPVFLGSSKPDPHVPFERVEQTAQVLEKLGAKVKVQEYPGMPHTINEEEIEIAREMIRKI